MLPAARLGSRQEAPGLKRIVSGSTVRMPSGDNGEKISSSMLRQKISSGMHKQRRRETTSWTKGEDRGTERRQIPLVFAFAQPD